MFIFYYSVLSEVSPPVGLSPFAAAALTGGNPYRTMMLSWKYALPAFLVPFMFTQPEGTAMLLRDTTAVEAIVATGTAAIGIAALVTGIGGYLFRRTTLLARSLPDRSNTGPNGPSLARARLAPSVRGRKGIQTREG